MNILFFIPLILSFFIVFLALPFWIKKTKKIGLIWRDMNKYGKPKNVAGSGGVITTLAFVLGVLSYVAIKTFILKTNLITIEIFALLTTVLISSFIGFIDDIMGWVHGGLSAKLRIFLILLSAIPLMVINVGESQIGIPFFGTLNIGLFYPLFFIPIGILGAATTYNFLAGYNGLETGQGILLVGALSLVSLFTGNLGIAIIGFCMMASLSAFLIFNKFPAEVFPGNILTYSVGALIAIMAILGNFERIAIFFFIPYIVETLLKIRGKLKKQSFGLPQKDGSLELPYGKIYGLEHLAIKILKKMKKNKKVYEKDVVYLIHAFQIIIIILGFIIFGGHIF